MPVDFGVAHVVAGCAGLVLAWAVLRPPFRLSQLRGQWPHLAAAGVAITVLMPVLVVLVDHTRFFVVRGMRDAGSPAFREPVVSEAAANDVRSVLRRGDTWAFTTGAGRCADAERLHWLAFKYVPHVPDCEAPDVELFWQQSPPPGARVIRSGPDYAVVRW
jgi:hypothetical protein